MNKIQWVLSYILMGYTSLFLLLHTILDLLIEIMCFVWSYFYIFLGIIEENKQKRVHDTILGHYKCRSLTDKR